MDKNIKTIFKMSSFLFRRRKSVSFGNNMRVCNDDRVKKKIGVGLGGELPL